jgi:hypothetical protein
MIVFDETGIDTLFLVSVGWKWVLLSGSKRVEVKLVRSSANIHGDGMEWNRGQ